jgi:transcriptional regulator of met regulon
LQDRSGNTTNQPTKLKEKSMSNVLKNSLLKTYLLKGKFIANTGNGAQTVTSLPIKQLTHRDRVAAERHAPDDATLQDDHMLHAMTGLPLNALDDLSYADSDALLNELFAMMNPVNASPLPEIVPAGTCYPLSAPLATPSGPLDTLVLRELTRADQKRAVHYSDLTSARDGFLIGAMAGVMIEDIDDLSIADSFALRGYFRRVVDTPTAVAAAGPVIDADPPGFDDGQLAGNGLV